PSSPVLLRVKEVLPISPSLRRITLAGPGMEHFPHHCPAAHIKVFLPRPHQEVPTLPELGPNGPIWPPAEVKPIVRTFSVRAFRPNQKELDIEFTCHGTIGPASRFALSAQVGDAIGISYPGGPDPMIVPADVYHMAADTSAL